MRADESTPFRRAQRPAGVTDWHLRTPAFRRLFHDVYVDRAAELTPVLLARAALLVVPDATLSHHSAARLWGGIVPDDGLVHLACPTRRAQVDGIRSHRFGPVRATTLWRQVPVTTPIQTFLDLAAVLGLVDLVVLGDSLVRRKRVTPDMLVEAADGHRGAGARQARRGARLVRAEVDSAMETRLRLLMVLSGLPEPVVNHKVRWPSGGVRFRFDLSYPDARLVIEYDGRQHAESAAQWGSDLGRREWLDGNDWRIVVVIATDLHRTPAATLHRIRAAMRQRGMTVPPADDRWRRHFTSLAGDVREPA
jgi:very-short-patch-repair endonuclease